MAAVLADAAGRARPVAFVDVAFVTFVDLAALRPAPPADAETRLAPDLPADLAAVAPEPAVVAVRPATARLAAARFVANASAMVLLLRGT